MLPSYKYASHTLALLALACVLGGASVSISSLWFLSPLSLAIFFYVIWKRTSTWIQAVFFGFVYGFITAGASVWWFWDALPFDWLGATNTTSGANIILIIWVTTCCILGLGIAIISPFIWLLRNNPSAPIAAALLWVLGEELRMWLHAFLIYGDESLLGPHFSIASLGYTFTENSVLLQFADPGGLQSLNFLVALMGASLTAFAIWILKFKSDHTFSPHLALPALLSIALLVYVLCSSTIQESLIPSDPTGKAKILIFSSGDSPQITKSDEFKKYIIQTLDDYKETPIDIVIFPEGYGLRELFGTDIEKRATYKESFGERDVLVITADYIEGETNTNTIVYESTTRGVLGKYQKMFLSPVGEQNPFLASYFFPKLHDPWLNTYMTSTRELERGRSLEVVSFGGATIGGLLCYEIFSPHLYRDLAIKLNANVLINMSDPTWFHNSKLYYSKMLQLSKVHAVQSRLYFIVSNKGTSSYVMDRFGRILQESPWNQTSSFEIDIPVQK